MQPVNGFNINEILMPGQERPRRALLESCY
jgi:hypothetical protein